MSGSSAALFEDSEDSEYKAPASEDSESDDDEVFAACKGKPNPGSTGKKLRGKGKRLQRKGKACNMTAAIPAIPPPPAKKAKTPTDKVCYSHIVISSLTL
jgi:hypothetical protein